MSSIDKIGALEPELMVHPSDKKGDLHQDDGNSTTLHRYGPKQGTCPAIDTKGMIVVCSDTLCQRTCVIA